MLYLIARIAVLTSNNGKVGSYVIKGVKKVLSALHHRISNHLKRKRC